MAVLPFLAPVMTAVAGWFAALSTAPARLQSTINDAFSSLMEELQVERARLLAHISELQSALNAERARSELLAGEVRQNQQLISSLRSSLASYEKGRGDGI